MFAVNEAAQGVLHVQDALGVSFTLIRGKTRGLLIDTGYGLENVRAFVDARADVPYDVILTHGHHDHILGAAYFDRVFLCADDREEYFLRSGRDQRRKIAERASQSGIPVPADYLVRPMPDPDPIPFPDRRGPFESLTADLGGLKAEILHVPGHTPGSAVVWLPERRLLLTGDNWNPCTWLWFPSSVSVDAWRANMLELLSLLPFEHVLCSHQPGIWKRLDLEDYLSWLSEDVLEAAPPADMGSDIPTRRAVWPSRGFEIVFDSSKRP